MERYQGPVFQSDEQNSAGKPAPTKAAQTDADKPVYHSVDPMSQFVTPPSTAPRGGKAAIDYSSVRRNMRRLDTDVVLLATEADADVPYADAQPAQTTESVPADVQAEPVAKPSAPDEKTSAVDETPTVVDEPTVAADILTAAADAEESDQIPATLTELAEQGKIQSRKAPRQQKAQRPQQFFGGGTRPNRLSIHQAFTQYKSSQSGHQKGHH